MPIYANSVDKFNSERSVDENMILVVKGGAKISKSGSTLVVSIIKRPKDSNTVSWDTISVPILDLEMLIVMGSRVRISSGAILMLSESDVPVLIHGRRGDVFLLNPFSVRIAEVRRRLYLISENISWRISVGKTFIEGKLGGMINIARYLTYKEAENNKDFRKYLEEISSIEKEIEKESSSVRSIDELRLYEAKWSKRLWTLLTHFIPSEYEFRGRDPKGGDPINSAINYAYAIIYGLCTHALIASGLDPYVGIIHTERAGRTSLTYDFSEMFKPLAIHAVIVSSKQTKISLDKKGYLTTDSLETVTKNIHRLLKRKHERWKYNARGEIYAKAWELRKNIEKGERFTPFIYRIK